MYVTYASVFNFCDFIVVVAMIAVFVAFQTALCWISCDNRCTMTAVSQLRLLTLNQGENGEANLYRLEKGVQCYSACL